MGKPAVNDLRSGLATAPTLYAAEEFPELLPLIQRRFKEVRAPACEPLPASCCLQGRQYQCKPEGRAAALVQHRCMREGGHVYANLHSSCLQRPIP